MRLLAHHPPDVDPSRPWEELEVAERGGSRIFRQLQAIRRSPHTAREHAFTRLLGPDWVNVIAFTRDLELLVVEQFRHGIDGATFEIPGGACDAEEDPSEAGLRELLEETGHRPSRWIALGSCTPNPATQANRCHTFLGLDCVPAEALALDHTEELRLWACGWGEWDALLRSGEIHHALVLTAFLKLRLWSGWSDLADQLGAEGPA